MELVHIILLKGRLPISQRFGFQCSYIYLHQYSPAIIGINKIYLYKAMINYPILRFKGFSRKSNSEEFQNNPLNLNDLDSTALKDEDEE